jgi:hypothetical protein
LTNDDTAEPAVSAAMAPAYAIAVQSRYEATVKPTAKGSWRIRAYYPSSATKAQKYSSWRYIKASLLVQADHEAAPVA